jgi:hypothetical protein
MSGVSERGFLSPGQAAGVLDISDKTVMLQVHTAFGVPCR